MICATRLFNVDRILIVADYSHNLCRYFCRLIDTIVDKHFANSFSQHSARNQQNIWIRIAKDLDHPWQLIFKHVIYCVI